MRLRLLAVLVLLVAPAALVPGAGAYRVEGKAWPNGMVPYYNAASDQAWAVAQAVNAWNASGARIRFVPVSLQSAKLVIRSTARRSCARAHATLGYGAAPTVWIWKAGGAASRCDPYWAAGALAHELGHVLGLGHENRGCAAMNGSGNRLGPSACEPVKSWQWRCRLLEHDDITGAVAIYGGAVRAPHADPGCDLYRPIRSPGYISSTLERDRGVLRVSLRRPAAPPIPAFLAGRQTAESYVRIWTDGRCPASYDAGQPRYRWPVGPDEITELVQRVPPTSGSHCFSIWALDGLGRPSTEPASISVSD